MVIRLIKGLAIAFIVSVIINTVAKAESPSNRDLYLHDQIQVLDETRFCRCPVNPQGRIDGAACDVPSATGYQAVQAQWVSMRQLGDWIDSSCAEATRDTGLQRAQCSFIQERLNRAWEHPVNQVLTTPHLSPLLDQHLWDLIATVEFKGASLGYDGCGISSRRGNPGLLMPHHLRGDFSRAVFFLVSRYDLPLPSAVVSRLDHWDYDDPVNGLEQNMERQRQMLGAEHNPLVLPVERTAEKSLRNQLAASLNAINGGEYR